MAESDADTLRRAAAQMRKPSRSTFPEAFRLALADWLDWAADIAPPDPHHEGECETCNTVSHAIAVASARAYLGERP